MFPSKSHRPVWADVHFDAIRNNFLAVKSRLPEETAIMGVVKADAYGHGAVAVSQELIKLGAEYLAISNLDEAMELRDAGVSCPILLLGPVESQEFGKIIQFNIFPAVTSLDYAKELAESYRYRGVFPKVHIKVDTGMGRLGLASERALLEIEQIAKIEGMIIDGIYSHLPSADSDLEYSKAQIKSFANLIGEIKKLGIKVRYFHIANSAGIFNLPESYAEPFNMVRSGLALYGYTTQKNPELKNSMTLKCRIIDIRKMKKGQTVSYLRTYKIANDNDYIAILPIGYADGIPTVYSNRGKVLIKGGYYPLVGRVCMDYAMVSLGKNDKKIAVGDEVSLFGDGKLSVELFGKACNRIPYEVTCGITKRVPRNYFRNEDER
jgi:alanine racemase